MSEDCTTPKKKDFRCKAHCSSFKSLGLNIPKNPNMVDWAAYFKNGDHPSFLDVGCGYGRFLHISSQIFPEKNILGFRNTKEGL